MEMPLRYGSEMETWLQVSISEKKIAARRKLYRAHFWQRTKDFIFLFLWVIVVGGIGFLWATYLGVTSMRGLMVLLAAGLFCWIPISDEIDAAWYAPRKKKYAQDQVDLGVEQEFIIPHFDSALADYYSCPEGDDQKKCALKSRKDAIKRLGERHGLSFWDRDDREQDWAFSHLEWGQ